MREPSDLSRQTSISDLPRPGIRRDRAQALHRRNRRGLMIVGLLIAATAGATIAFYSITTGAVSHSVVPPTALAVPNAVSTTVIVPTPPPPPTPTPAAIRPRAVIPAPPVTTSGPGPTRRPGSPDPDPSTDHVVVVDGDSGAVLFQRNAREPIAPASLTKIMTAILGIEFGNLSEQVEVTVDARSLPDSTVMGLEPGFDITLEDLLYGLMLPSGNDAALVIARYVSGSDAAFVTLMNQKAEALGLRSTHFANPHGLDAPDHYSSPYDMVVLARYGMQYPIFRKLAAARTYDIRRSNISYTIENLNPLLWAYPGADGVKVGYTDESGRAIVASAVRNGHRVYVAFMRSKAGLVPDATELFDWAFNSFIWPENGGGAR